MPMKPRTHQPSRGKARQHRQPRADDSFYDTARWRRLRRMVLARAPLCADVFGHHEADGVTVPAVDVDHIIERSERPDLELDMGNLQPLCKACHTRKTHGSKIVSNANVKS